ncbi:uncharacterized protein PgNI_01738 [Pyricularia grisea]|uniref:Secreted protein n=1 Tax=Pyricularia grisea TaxID=148305 RepID=A0A6P8BLZ9_PYRGI|nr:uncharacterized protein PgNI_01738 [Pyricularia grisea]TLD17622.1 hypothetical protein PgNI_01738 [Pyricularia grisea]
MLLWSCLYVVLGDCSAAGKKELKEERKKKIKTRCSKFHADLRFSWATSARLLARLLRTTGRYDELRRGQIGGLRQPPAVGLKVTLFPLPPCNLFFFCFTAIDRE